MNPSLPPDSHRHLSNGTARRALTAGELFEWSSLDALGLLEEHERRAFEDAFAAASPALKAQLRAQQSRIANPNDLPPVEPAASLRTRVLARIQAAIDATLPARSAVAGRIGPVVLPSRGVSAAWRAAAIGYAAAAIVFGVSTLQMKAQYADMENALKANAVAEMFVKEFGPRFQNALMAPDTRFVQFNSGDTAEGAPETSSAAVLLLNDATKSGQFYCRDLPANGGTYALSIVGPDGTIGRAILTFQAGGSLIASDIPALDLAAGATLAITGTDADGQPVKVLRSANL